MWGITKKYILSNLFKTAEKPKYIVIHDTGNTSFSANAFEHWKYFNDKSAQVSYHFICDDKNIFECADKGIATYHTKIPKSGIRGDGKLSMITNQNSIGIAYCICKGCDIKRSAYNAAVAAAAACRKYGLTPFDIVRHYDVTEEICPYTMYENKTGLSSGGQPWQDFEAFKELVGNILEGMQEAEPICQSLLERGVIKEADYWQQALSGITELNEKWVRMVLKKLTDM